MARRPHGTRREVAAHTLSARTIEPMGRSLAGAIVRWRAPKEAGGSESAIVRNAERENGPVVAPRPRAGGPWRAGGDSEQVVAVILRHGRRWSVPIFQRLVQQERYPLESLGHAVSHQDTGVTRGEVERRAIVAGVGQQAQRRSPRVQLQDPRSTAMPSSPLVQQRPPCYPARARLVSPRRIFGG